MNESSTADSSTQGNVIQANYTEGNKTDILLDNQILNSYLKFDIQIGSDWPQV